MKETGGAERRKTFRVQDQIMLDYEVVSETEMRGALRNITLVDSGSLNASTTLRRLESDLQRALAALQKTDKELARTLDLLNNKINTIAGLVPDAVKLDPALEKRDVCECSLSASGLAFTCKESFEAGTKLRLRMVILPNYHHVVAYAEVVRSTDMEEPRDGFTQIVAVHFVHILDRYREILARRALQREIEDLRAERQRTEKEMSEALNAVPGSGQG